MTDVVIGVVRGHVWAEIAPYAVSLSRCGFKGTKAMFVSQIDKGTENNLRRLGFQLLPFALRSDAMHLNVDRFQIVGNWLRTQNFRNVIWTDVRDVVFQADPAAWLAQNMRNDHIIAGSECVLIKDEPLNSKWMQAFKDDYEWVKDFQVLNGGTFAGAAFEMGCLFFSIYNLCYVARCNDQAALNLLLRQTPFKEVTRVPLLKEGFAAVCHGLGQPQKFVGKLQDTPPTMRNGFLVNSEGVPLCIVHQYDRNKPWAAELTNKYRG